MHNQGIKVPNINGKKPGRRWLLWSILGCGGLLFVGALLSVIFVLWAGISFWRYAENWDKKDEPWVECAFDVPDSAVRVVFLRQHAHPFLAEYDRKIRLESPGKDPVTLDLPPNTGGQTMINVYRHTCLAEDGTELHALRLKGRHVNAIVDLREPRFLKKDMIADLGEGEYLGRFDGRDGPLKFVAADEAPEKETGFN